MRLGHEPIDHRARAISDAIMWRKDVGRHRHRVPAGPSDRRSRTVGSPERSIVGT
jgi:hypothetical protein